MLLAFYYTSQTGGWRTPFVEAARLWKSATALNAVDPKSLKTSFSKYSYVIEIPLRT
jgi:hypothetical protein